MGEHILNIRPDTPCKDDALGFKKYIDTLGEMISDPEFKTPFCIGIYGKWGSGKTSFMQLLEKKISENPSEPRAIPVWFNPWRYQKEDHLIIPFLKTIESEIERYAEKNIENKTLFKTLKRAARKLGHASAAFAYGLTLDCKLAGIGFKFDTAKAAKREEELNKRDLEENKKQELSSIYYDIVRELEGIVFEGEKEVIRIVVFIDDLDRCLPEKAVELLEAMKLFLDIPGYLFILGVDKNVVKKGISYRYRFFEHRAEKKEEGLVISPEDYLEKMIQLPLEIPTVEAGRKEKYIQSLLGDKKGFSEHAVLIEAGIGDGGANLNPRALKRFVNLLAFTVRLAETTKRQIIEDEVEQIENPQNKKLIKEYFVPLLYIKWAIIVFRYPIEHNMIKGNWRRLIVLQEAATHTETNDIEEGEKRIQIDERLKTVLKREPLFPDDHWLISRFIHLTESTVISQKEGSGSKGTKQSYQPGDMVKIPKGAFFYGEEKIKNETIKEDFYMDVFPVTNRQYLSFIEETEHRIPFEEEDWDKPYNWDKKKKVYAKGLDDHPVILVSHEDAIAFCKWRSLKEEKSYRLPLEEEWEKAARGEDGRLYPWGNDFDKGKCNTSESGFGKTSPVTLFTHSLHKWHRSLWLL